MTVLELPTPLVSVSWLARHLSAPGLIVLDASMKPIASKPAQHGPAPGLRLPGARVFDFDRRICDRASALPHMMPSAEVFTQEVCALGVGRASAIVVYDRIGVYSSPRAWWMFKAMGHDAVAVLDGGLPAWREAGLPCAEGEEPAAQLGDFLARPRPGLFCDADHVARALSSSLSAVLDARPEARFAGREPEPRAGLRAGHMPNALNLPFSAVQARGHLLPPAELRALFASRVAADTELVLSCGSGVTACIVALAATLAGHAQLTVYDGSWSEWGLPSSRPVVGADGGIALE